MNSRTFVTGFGPFGQVQVNPSATLAGACGRPSQVIEVAYEAADAFLAGLPPDSFDRLLLMGVAQDRAHISIELFGRNFKNGHKDVNGCGEEGPIEEGGIELLESQLWTPEITSEIVATDLNLRISMDAGEYLCNYIYYRAMQHFPYKPVGFLHVAGVDKLPLAEQAKSLDRILTILER